MTGSLLDRKVEAELAKGDTGRLSAIRRSRAFRTFVRDKGAVVACFVIAAYLSVALLIIGAQLTAAVGDRLGLNLSDTFVIRELSLKASLDRVGPDSLPGLLEEPTADKRLQNAEFYLSRIERAFERDDPVAAFQSERLAERTLADKPVEELRALLGVALERLDSVDETYLDAEILAEDLADARYDLEEATTPEEQEAAREAIDDLEAQLADARRAVQHELDELEAAIQGIMPMPDGFAGMVYRARLLLGTDSQGRSILWRAIYSIRVATQVGLVSAIIAVVVGAFLGAAAGFFGGWVDHAIVWLYSTLSSVPYIVLLTVVAFVFGSLQVTVPFTDGVQVHQTLIPMYVAFGVTFWIAPCRQIRGEAMKIRSLDYVQSATSLGAGRFYIMRRHVIPNVLFLVFINFSLIFIGAIKSEVILSFLGIGVVGQPSWGVMISESKSEVLNQFFWQIGTATVFMFGLVLAFNVFSDALQDAFDPKHAR